MLRITHTPSIGITNLLQLNQQRTHGNLEHHPCLARFDEALPVVVQFSGKGEISHKLKDNTVFKHWTVPSFPLRASSEHI